ncbi:hypothetical protein [Coleofasciculus sp. E1-EBD-02]
MAEGAGCRVSGMGCRVSGVGCGEILLSTSVNTNAYLLLQV